MEERTKVPLSSSSLSTSTLLQNLIQKLKNSEDIIDANYFARIIEKIIKKIDLVDILQYDKIIDDAIEIILQRDCLKSFADIIINNKAKFTVKRIKHFARFIVVNHYHSDSLKVLLRHFPWLLNTWIDNYGYTLLCICVKSRYKYLKNLLELYLVKKYIDVEDKNGNNPLFITTFDFKDGDYEYFNMLREIGGADVTHVNCNGNAVFDSISLLYKVDYLMRFLPYIKGETAFKLMMVQIRRHIIRDYDNKRCVICLKNFINYDSPFAFVCGHFSHKDCWKNDVSSAPPKKDECIVCPSDVILFFMNNNISNTTITVPPIITVGPLKPPTKPKKFKIIDDCDNDKRYRINNEFYSEIVRYKYFVNNRWVDESLLFDL